LSTVALHLWLPLAILFATAAVAAAAADNPGGVRVEQVAYAGWKNNLKISNGTVEVIVTLDVGPRVISYKLAGGRNVFKEFADQLGTSGESDWIGRGGHRLWTAPEDLTRTYALDNRPVAHAILKQNGETHGARLTPPPDMAYGVQKEIEVTLDSRGSRVTVAHTIKNVGQAPVELAPWALTVLDAGGVEIIPLPPKRPHPGSPKNAKSPADYAPVQALVLWPFTDLSDARYTWGGRYILLRQDARRGPTKIGIARHQGWLGYLNHGTLFVKHLPVAADGQHYPDRGCNFETFTNETMLEMESLGPLVTLAPGAISAAHTEVWELVDGIEGVKSDADVEAKVLPKLGAM
jgi:hypothetical protein